jgi:Ca-activated chloride channel homolog
MPKVGSPGLVRRLTTACCLLLLALFCPAPALGSAASALRDYKAGRYAQALDEYERLLKQEDDARLHFNAGAAAYRDKKFEQAAKQFEEALNSPDLKLQQRAYYNHGNTLYQLGLENPDRDKKIEAWTNAIQDFQSSLELNPQDADAATNRQFVKWELEHLPKPPPQPQQSQSNKSKPNKNQKQQKQQSGQSKQQPGRQPKQAKSQQNQKQNQQAQPQQPQQAKQKPKKQKANPAAAQRQQPKPGQKKKEKTYPAGQMTPQEAKQLLDSLKGDEMMLPASTNQKSPEQTKPLQDW